MCGIAGVWRKQSPVTQGDLADISVMMRAIGHRGPDDHGSWNNGRIAFGHRRLSIIDLSPEAKQPMLTPCGEGVLVYNGEVYNFQELRASLRAEGVVFRTGSDTEVVLEALHRWGPKTAIPLFNGMFALAYFDARASELWLARDRLGIKPLSVADTGDRIIFGSEDKAILACGHFHSQVEAREITLRLAGQYRDSSASLFRGIDRLPPAGLWRISDAGIDRTCFWHVLDVLDTERITDDATPDWSQIAKLETMLEESIGRHCIADATLATACSGGVDSGLITALAKRFRPRMHGYVVDPLLGHSEAAAAERTASRAGVELRRVPLDRSRFLELWPKMVWHLESDGWHASRVALLALAKQCREDGVKVLLTGEGADELFGGYDWQRASMKRWRSLVWPWNLIRSKGSFARRMERLRQAPFDLALGKASPFERSAIQRALSPELNFLQTRIFDRLEPVTPLTDRAFLGSCIYGLYSHLQDLLHRHDRLSMASSVELRVPFIENRIIDFAIHLPLRFKYRARTGKWLLKKVAERHLPSENVYARKIGFGISENFTEGGEGLLRDGLLRDVMRWPSASVGDLVNLAASDETSRLRLVGMELFLRLYAGGENPEGLSEKLKAVVTNHAKTT